MIDPKRVAGEIGRVLFELTRVPKRTVLTLTGLWWRRRVCEGSSGGRSKIGIIVLVIVLVWVIQVKTAKATVSSGTNVRGCWRGER